MKSPLVADTGPLIGLARVGHLPLLFQLHAPILIPPAVHRELRLADELPGSSELQQALAQDLLHVANPEIPDSSRFLWEVLDDGEVEAILLASQRDAVLLIDDKRGRVLAKRRGARITGVAGILLVAKKKGLLTAVAPALDDLISAGYRLSPRLVDRVRHLADEG